MTTASELSAVRQGVEALVDKHSLSTMLEVLATICDDKAAHIEEAWQARTLAGRWRRWGGRLHNAAIQTGTLG